MVVLEAFLFWKNKRIRDDASVFHDGLVGQVHWVVSRMYAPKLNC